jgi:hypothetical protein
MADFDLSSLNDEFGNFSPRKMLKTMGHGQAGGPAMPGFINISEFRRRTYMVTEKPFEEWNSL